MNMETHVDHPAGDDAEEHAEDVSSEEDDDSSDEETADGKKKRLGNAGRRTRPANCRHVHRARCKDSREAAADMLKRFFNRS